MELLRADAFERLVPGRRLVFTYPVVVACEKAGNNSRRRVSVVVMDSAVDQRNSRVECAAMVVPCHKERDWIYASEGGQWQLLASAAASRLIMIFRNGVLLGEGGENCANDDDDDEGLKKQLGPLVVALAPRICFQAGPPVIPFVSYADNILQRIVVERAYSTLTGAIVVEDLCDEEDRNRKSVRVVWRRRLRFKRMPNLIQTEVSLNFQSGTQTSASEAQINVKDLSSVDRIVHGRTQRLGVCGQTNGGLHLDHSRLVHKYLAPIVAGLVLVAPALEAWMELGKRVKVLALGIGGGALPIFLHKHFHFHIQAVELDEVVLDLACRHFGLIEDALMTVEVGDGTVTIDRIAMQVARTGTVAVPLLEAWQQACDNSAHHPSSLSDLNSDFTHKDEKPVAEHRVLVDSNILNVGCKNCHRAHSGKSSMLCESCDPRVHVIIVDVDEGDARLGLSSPPSSFLQCRFLMGTKIALHRGGILAMNVVPFEETLYQGVIATLMGVFEEVYETVVEDDVNRVVFALPSAAACVRLDGPLVSLIKQLVDAQLLTRIHKFGVSNTESMDLVV
ncbi:unnamed protein product [Sphagnum troendelagicum]|uniref:Methyltransferase-like protein 13 n=1 Tax=Sphagnum troendelagicum TaxID=128251 RepID=A0ABP0U7S1_9BRYO